MVWIWNVPPMGSCLDYISQLLALRGCRWDLADRSRAGLLEVTVQLSPSLAVLLHPSYWDVDSLAHCHGRGSCSSLSSMLWCAEFSEVMNRKKLLLPSLVSIRLFGQRHTKPINTPLTCTQQGNKWTNALSKKTQRLGNESCSIRKM